MEDYSENLRRAQENLKSSCDYQKHYYKEYTGMYESSLILGFFSIPVLMSLIYLTPVGLFMAWYPFFMAYMARTNFQFRESSWSEWGKIIADGVELRQLIEKLIAQESEGEEWK